MTETTTQKSMEVQRQEEMSIVKRARQRTFSPRVDIYEENDTVLLLAEMPGVGEDGIEVTLDKDILTVRGEVDRGDLDGYKPAYVEHATGNFERKFKLSDDVNRENIEAAIKDGLLTVVLPKAEIAKTKKIVVKGA